MKKRLLVLLVLVLVPVSGWAALQAAVMAGPRNGAAVSSAFQASMGVLGGEAKEHVYDTDTGSRRQLSRLDWDLSGIVMGGVNGSVRVMDKLTLNGGIWSAVTEGGGEMDDYDWLEPSSSDWTHYSLSDVDVTEGYILDLNAAWDLLVWEDLTARAVAGYKYNTWTWEDRGVYLLYPEYGYVPEPLYGENGINYEQEFNIPYLGVSADWAIGDLTVSGYIHFSPIVSATDKDQHVARTLNFTETFDGGDMLGAGMEARYAFTEGFWKNIFVSAALDYQKVDLIVGDMAVVNYTTGETGSGKDVAGIENEYVTFSVGGGMRF